MSRRKGVRVSKHARGLGVDVIAGRKPARKLVQHNRVKSVRARRVKLTWAKRGGGATRKVGKAGITPQAVPENLQAFGSTQKRINNPTHWAEFRMASPWAKTPNQQQVTAGWFEVALQPGIPSKGSSATVSRFEF